MYASLPDVLPPVLRKERHETNLALRYDFNYCTYSYSMAFWDWKRWEKELDWMALHGINLPLAAVGHECVWRNLLLRLGFSKQQINNFIAGPAFLAWWEMTIWKDGEALILTVGMNNKKPCKKRYCNE